MQVCAADSSGVCARSDLHRLGVVGSGGGHAWLVRDNGVLSESERDASARAHARTFARTCERVCKLQRWEHLWDRPSTLIITKSTSSCDRHLLCRRGH
eukprot:2746504-Pleurochrysis_carterae.AAC.1